MFLMGSRIIIAPFKVVIAVMILFRLFWKVFVYSSIVCDVDWYIRVTKEIHYKLQRVAYTVVNDNTIMDNQIRFQLIIYKHSST